MTRRLLLAFPAAFCLPAAEPAWRARVATADEPGEKLIITGRVRYAADRRPVPGAVLTVYQTDAKGIYGTADGRPEEIARLRGRLITGPDGEYEVHTIKPGNYPGGNVPAHIHAAVALPGEPPRVIPDFLFAGDRFLSPTQNGFVLALTRDAGGVWHGTREILVER